MNEQTHAKFSIPVKASGAQINNPKMASGSLKMGNCFQLPGISDSYLPIALIKKVYVSRYTTLFVQKSTKGHPNTANL